MKTARWPSLLALALGVSGCLDFETSITRYDCSDAKYCLPPVGDGDGRALSLEGAPTPLTVGAVWRPDAWIEVAASDGNPRSGVAVSFEILGGGSATGARLADTSETLTNSEGRALLPTLDPGTVPGTFTLRASSNRLAPIDIVFTVNRGQASSIEVTLTSTSILLHDAYVIEAIVVRDGYGNELPNPTVELRFPNSGASFNCDGPGSNPLVTTVADLGLPKSCFTNDLEGDPTFVVTSTTATTTLQLHQHFGPVDHFRADWPRTFNFAPGVQATYNFMLEDALGNVVGPTDTTFSASAPASGATCQTLTTPTFTPPYVSFVCTTSSTVGPFEISLTLTRGTHTSTLVVPVGIVPSGFGGGVSLTASPDCITSRCTVSAVGSTLAPITVRATSGSSSPVPGARLSLEISPSGVAHFDESGYSDYVEFAGSRAVTRTDANGYAQTPVIVIDRSESFDILLVSAIDGSSNAAALKFDPAVTTGAGATTP